MSSLGNIWNDGTSLKTDGEDGVSVGRQERLFASGRQSLGVVSSMQIEKALVDQDSTVVCLHGDAAAHGSQAVWRPGVGLRFQILRELVDEFGQLGVKHSNGW